MVKTRQEQSTTYMPKPNVNVQNATASVPVTNIIPQSRDSVNTSTVIQEIKKDASLDGVGDDFVQRITKAAEDNKLVVTNINKAEKMLATIGIQPAEVSGIINLANNTVSH